MIRCAEVVADLYDVLLGRPVDPDGLRDKLASLAARTRTVSDIARELIGSEEFDTAAPLQTRVASHVEGDAP